MQKPLRGFPVPCKCGRHQRPRGPAGYTHLPTERCPHVVDAHQWEVTEGTCCTFDLSELCASLEAIDEPALGHEVARTMSAEEAVAFGRRLEFAAGRLYSFVDEGEELALLDEISAAGQWYADVGTAGCGVLPISAPT